LASRDQGRRRRTVFISTWSGVGWAGDRRSALSFELVPRRWPGWEVEFWQERYEDQVAECAGFVRLPAVDVDRGLAEIEEYLEAELGDPLDGLGAYTTGSSHMVRSNSPRTRLPIAKSPWTRGAPDPRRRPGGRPCPKIEAIAGTHVAATVAGRSPNHHTPQQLAGLPAEGHEPHHIRRLLC